MAKQIQLDPESATLLDTLQARHRRSQRVLVKRALVLLDRDEPGNPTAPDEDWTAA